MKVLSVKNPLSYMICHGIKDIENRTWKTDYRGELLIYSCGKIEYKEILDEFFDKKTWKEIINNEKNPNYEESDLMKKYIDLTEVSDRYLSEKKEYYFKSGLIIGSVNLVDIIQNSKSPFAIKGQYHWIFENPKLLEVPIKAVGKLSLWEFKI